jgi:hypothetical protein
MRQDFWSRFHRRFHFSIDEFGICFDYKGDEVIWLWWWKREKNRMWKFYSIGFNCTFRSLKQIDNLWEQYWESEKEHPYERL